MITPSEVRTMVLEYFFKRGLRIAQSADQILVLVNLKGLTLDALEEALEFLKECGHITFEHETFGSTKFWKITASGMLFWERERAK